MSVYKNILPNIRMAGIEPISKDGTTPGDHDALRSLDLLRLSTEMQQIENNDLCPKGLSVLCSDFDDQSLFYREWVASAGGNLMVATDESPSIDWFVSYADCLDFVLLDSDWIGDVEDTVDFCLRLRRAAPGLPIILISSDVREDDFTAERMMACDATLRAPTSEARLLEAIRAAYETNARFNYRSRGQPQSLGERTGSVS